MWRWQALKAVALAFLLLSVSGGPATAAKVCVLCSFPGSSSSTIACYNDASCVCAQKYGGSSIRIPFNEIHSVITHGMAGKVMLNEAWHVNRLIDIILRSRLRMGCVNTSIVTP